MYPQPNLDAYQRQASDLVAKIGQLQQLQQQTPTFAPPPVIPKIQYVRGLAGAKEFQTKMPACGDAVLMDMDDAVFYVVSKDANGNPAPIAFAHFTLETEQTPKDPEYVTKEDLETFKAELKALFAQKGDKA